MSNSKKHTLSSREIFSYDYPHASHQDTAAVYDDDDYFLSPQTHFPAEENRFSPPFSNQEVNYEYSRQRPESIRKVLDLSPLQLKLVVGKKQSGLKKIKRRTNVEVTPRFLGKNGNKLIIDGNEEDVEVACDMVSSMLTKITEKDPVNETEKMAETETEVELKSKKNESTPNENLPSDASSNSPLQENTLECTTHSEESFPGTSSSPQEYGNIFRVPLPSERLSAIKSIKALVQRIPQWTKRCVKMDTLERFVRYFKSRTMSECETMEKRREFLNQMQRLSYVLYTNSRFENAQKWLVSLRQYKNMLLKETGQFIAPELHEEISRIYCNIANPSLKDLPNLLNLAESQIKGLQAEIEEEKKRGIKHSGKNRKIKIRIKGDKNKIDA